MRMDTFVSFMLPDNTLFSVDAFYDERGVLRFKPNTLLDLAFDNKLFSLNDFAELYYANRDKIKLEDVIRVWASLGYSVDSLCDMSFLSDVRVITPDWVKERENE